MEAVNLVTTVRRFKFEQMDTLLPSQSQTGFTTFPRRTTVVASGSTLIVR